MLATFKNALFYEQFDLTHAALLEPFILTDILSEYAGSHQTVCFHFWSMRNAVILGMKDTRVTYLEKGIEHLLDKNYYPVVRNSGGLAVVADEGILNFSIILPKKEKEAPFSIDAGYQLMKTIIEKTFQEFNSQIEAFEISDSYCPGHFDLSINGKKFAGISQRRIKNGVAVLIYLSVSGNQKFRGELVRDFYQLSLGDSFGRDGYPPVNPESMATLSELLKTPLSVNDVYWRLKQLLANEATFNSDEQEAFNCFLTSPKIREEVQFKRNQMKRRNAVINGSEINDSNNG